MSSEIDSAITMRPIGTLRSPLNERAEAPRQPRAALGIEGSIELFPGHGYEDALLDLEGWQYVWVLAWFDRNTTWHPKVQPPRSRKKRGVFSTRSPHRPNPIALSVFELVGVEGLTVRVRNVDLLDGTPVLDIKPYVPWTDAITEARVGWLASEGDASRGVPDPGPSYSVEFTDESRELLALIATAEAETDMVPTIVSTLELGPQPHAYRRIKRIGERYVLGVGDWRIGFRAEAQRITVDAVRSMLKKRELEIRPAGDIHRVIEARYAAE
jgi:tRNA-Thr(GGU) m(6)t(6)A37 methyltransferase TsaA